MSPDSPKEDTKRENLGAKVLIAKDLGVSDDQLKGLNADELNEIITYYQTKKNTGTPQFLSPTLKAGSPPGVAIPDPQDPATVPPETVSEVERYNAAFNPRHPIRGRRWNNDACLLTMFVADGTPKLF